MIDLIELIEHSNRRNSLRIAGILDRLDNLENKIKPQEQEIRYLKRTPAERGCGDNE